MIPQHGILEISRRRLAHNLALLRGHIGPEPIMCAAIKADAYGHGCHLLVPLLLEQNVRWCCVYSLEEAVALCHYAWEGLLVLAPLVLPGAVHGPLEPLLKKALANKVRLTLADATSARHLAAFAREHGNSPVPVHVQVDTGLTRLGILPHAAEDLAAGIADLPGLHLEGAYAHFSHGDVPNHETLSQQYTPLQRFADTLKKTHPQLMVHLQNSGGTWNLEPPRRLGLDMVRLGIGVYGLQPSTDHPIPGLHPIARLTAPILAIHHCPAGIGVGYGHTFITKRPTTLGVVPVGYADGYPRQLSNTPHAVFQLRGTTARIVGRVSMDQIIVDLTDIPGATLGDVVTIISDNPEAPNSLDAMAAAIGTIGYELATHFGPRLKRVVTD